MASTEVEHFPDRVSALTAEQLAIDAESPRYNRVRSVGKTPLHSFRCSDELWDAAKATAEKRGETVADVLRKALKRYVRSNR